MSCLEKVWQSGTRMYMRDLMATDLAGTANRDRAKTHHGKISCANSRNMIGSIHIRGYRAFDRFDLENLARINLLVGSNNSGKTSLLEAIYLLTSRGDPWAIWQILNRRGERLSAADVDLSHLFHGHELRVGSIFTLSAKNQTPERKLEFSIAELNDKEQREMLGHDEEDGPIPSRLALSIKGRPSPALNRIPLNRTGGISSDAFTRPAAIRRRTSSNEQTQFITADSSTSEELVALWDNIALRPEEAIVLRALQYLDPNIDRISSQAGYGVRGTFYPPLGRTRGGFIIKLKNYEQPIPIGSMGDGMWRMLAMAIAISQCKGGVLLIDEIDSGLHYTVMSDMWTLIYRAAQDFDVQVFATTHSSDCVRSLSTLCVDHGRDVVLQRIETGKRTSVLYSEEEIRIAAERGIEVR
jgi:hypothetical protein